MYLFVAIGLEQPQSIPLLTVGHQVAQKLYACTSVDSRIGQNGRAHVLVDLQILDHEEVMDKVAVASIARRLFAARYAQPWPPVVVAHSSWQAIYIEAAHGLAVRPDVDQAVTWANEFIASLDAA